MKPAKNKATIAINRKNEQKGDLDIVARATQLEALSEEEAEALLLATLAGI